MFKCYMLLEDLGRRVRQETGLFLTNISGSPGVGGGGGGGGGNWAAVKRVKKHSIVKLAKLE